eukprot:TRINITY_DN1847_c0_g3_i1.p1 TRINITY_DN1847_c0_g3~~TRINITY_DN1847_c0_g3_i1.p1  ORF type:complete len:438 (-),score=32.55 TRINITY_DN1847_c0_g3_i1:1347-2660(-)
MQTAPLGFSVLRLPPRLNFEVHRFCRDLQNGLSIKSSRETYFSAVFELLGPFASAEEDIGTGSGYLQLMLVEYQGSQCDLDDTLPSCTAWKDAAFVSQLLELNITEYVKKSLEEVVELLQMRGNLSLREPRHQFGWFERASRLLRTAAQDSGYGAPRKIVQKLMGPTSTVLRADCENGFCFLKSPLPISREADTTLTLIKLFPSFTPVVLQIITELNAFVTRGFHHTELSRADILGISLEMGRMQLTSLDFTAELRASGCDLCGPLELASKVAGWLDDDVVRWAFGGWIDELEEYIPTILQMCEELAQCRLPMTLVHGDLYPHNATLRECGVEDGEKVYMLFDWEYAYVGHPFGDLGTLVEKMSTGEIERYLTLWLQYDCMEELKKSLRVGSRLGWCFRLCKLFDYFVVRTLKEIIGCRYMRGTVLMNYATPHTISS